MTTEEANFSEAAEIATQRKAAKKDQNRVRSSGVETMVSDSLDANPLTQPDEYKKQVADNLRDIEEISPGQVKVQRSAGLSDEQIVENLKHLL